MAVKVEASAYLDLCPNYLWRAKLIIFSPLSQLRVVSYDESFFCYSIPSKATSSLNPLTYSMLNCCRPFQYWSPLPPIVEIHIITPLKWCNQRSKLYMFKNVSSNFPTFYVLLGYFYSFTNIFISNLIFLVLPHIHLSILI